MGLLEDVQRVLKMAPAGSLGINSSHGYSQYHLISNGASTYLSKKKDKEVIGALAKKEYYLRLQDAIWAEIQAIDSYGNSVPCPTVERVYEELIPALQNYVIPIENGNQQIIDDWYARHQPWTYNLQPFTGNYTYKGIRFRSRAELILATLLDQLDIPWVYEYPIQVTKDGYTETIFPDFTVLNIRTRQTFHLEYFGKMSDPKYMEINYRRLKLYEENGIFLGKQLIIIGESREKPLDIPHTEKVLREYLT